MILARDTPYHLDAWQYRAYGIGGYAIYKEATVKVREHASEILTVQWNRESSVETRWTCTASCCATKGRWYGRKDKFNMHHLKKHAGGNASFVETVNKAKNGTKVGFCSLCPSARMTPMSLWNLKSHLASAGIHVSVLSKRGGSADSREGVCVRVCGKGDEEVGSKRRTLQERLQAI